MNTTESKPQEPIIFYNPNVPLQFSQRLVSNLEKKAEQTTEKTEARQIESIVRQRVAQELERLKKNESDLSEKFYIELSEKNNAKQQEGNLNAVDTKNDIEAMAKRISRSGAKELSTKIQKAQDQVITCYKNNQARSLDCWKEVEQFKQIVAEEQKKFIASQQK